MPYDDFSYLNVSEGYSLYSCVLCVYLFSHSCGELPASVVCHWGEGEEGQGSQLGPGADNPKEAPLYNTDKSVTNGVIHTLMHSSTYKQSLVDNMLITIPMHYNVNIVELIISAQTFKLVKRVGDFFLTQSN